MNAKQLYVGKAQEMQPSGVWFCEKCRGVHRNEEEADRCCKPQVWPGRSVCKACSDAEEKVATLLTEVEKAWREGFVAGNLGERRRREDVSWLDSRARRVAEGEEV